MGKEEGSSSGIQRGHRRRGRRDQEEKEGRLGGRVEREWGENLGCIAIYIK
jgi:hypothetical protein